MPTSAADAAPGSPGNHRRSAVTGQRGFTLLEVLVALIIFALTFGALAQIIQTGLRQSGAAATATEATLLARSILARVGSELPIEARRDEGEAANGYRWESLITPLPSEEERPDLVVHQIDVTVFWGAQPNEQSLTLTSLRLGAEEP